MRNLDEHATSRLLIALLCFILSAVTAVAQSSGGNYRITSSVVAGGGGASAGSGNKVIEGTSGQSAAGGPQTGSSISHLSGFWPTTLAQSGPQQGGQTTLQFSSISYLVQEDLGALAITVTRSGDTSLSSSVNYSTNDGAATQKGDFEYAAGRLVFAPGETSKTFQVLINEDMYSDFNETFTVSLSNPTGAVLGQQNGAIITVTDDSPESQTNPIDDAQSFVYMQYHDFLNREPDPAGLAFWTNEITSCAGNQACIDIKRVNVSAAFFISIEFQETGYLVHRIYKAAYGNLSGAPVPIKLSDFLPDTQEIGKGVVVNQPGWQQVLENNKQALLTAFVQRPLFTLEYPTSSTPAQFVDNLFLNAGVSPSAAERQDAIDVFTGAATSADIAARARSLRLVAENGAFAAQEFNRAFVLMQYIGYLRRNPNDAPEPGLNYDGYNFWLNKLNQFNGNFVNAEMVKAFIVSGEYRQRFGQ
jgi:hypothetical protein